MSKKKSDSLPLAGLTVQAVVCFRVDHLSGEAFVLDIENGVVKNMSRAGRGPDLPAAAIGAAQRALWNQLRTQQYPVKEETDENKDA